MRDDSKQDFKAAVLALAMASEIAHGAYQAGDYKLAAETLGTANNAAGLVLLQIAENERID